MHVAALGVHAAAPTAAPWHPQERCKLLQLPGEDFRTLRLKRQRDRRQERALAPAATTPGMPGCTGALPCRDQSPVASSIAWASGLPPGLPASRQCALRQAPPASGVARGGLQPRRASADTQRCSIAQPGSCSIAPTSLVLRTGARCLHSLQSVMASSRGQPNTSSPLLRNWLQPSMLDRGVTPAPADARLGCFVRACAARPVVVPRRRHTSPTRARARARARALL